MNSYKLVPENQKLSAGELKPGGQADISLKVVVGGEGRGEPETPFKIQVALGCNQDFFVFQVPCSFHVLLKQISDQHLISVTYLNDLKLRPNQVKGSHQVKNFSRTPAELI